MTWASSDDKPTSHLDVLVITAFVYEPLFLSPTTRVLPIRRLPPLFRGSFPSAPVLCGVLAANQGLEKLWIDLVLYRCLSSCRRRRAPCIVYQTLLRLFLLFTSVHMSVGLDPPLNLRRAVNDITIPHRHHLPKLWRGTHLSGFTRHGLLPIILIVVLIDTLMFCSSRR